MRAPLSWLRDFAPFPDDVGALRAALDDLGLVVEGIEHVGEGLGDVVVSRVLEIGPIKGADKIRRVVVDAGAEPLEIVCGAHNFAVGDRVPLAPVGAILPGGFEIARRKMRGVSSNGMLCSGRELGLSDDGAGLLILGDEAPGEPGTPLTEALGLEPDTVFDITVEGNRPDAWSMVGIARDLAARLGLPFDAPEPPDPPPSGRPVESAATATVESPDLCPRLTVTVLDDVVVGPSPRWIAQRLLLAGMRPINNVVDASNYVMLELGQPTHPYDLALLPGRGLSVRRAREGETLVTLDGVERTLGVRGRSLGDTGEDCLICDAEGTPVGIGGIMGGASSEISDSTDRGAARGGLLRADGDRPHVQAPGPAHRGVGPLRARRRPLGDRAGGAPLLPAAGRERPRAPGGRRHARRPRRGARALRGVGARRPRAQPDRRRARARGDRPADRAHRVHGAGSRRGPTAVTRR